MSSPIPSHENQFHFIPAGRLTLSPLNVRKTGAEEGIEELAALIRSEGVLQNLTAYAEPDVKPAEAGRYAVVAGGRRWRALQRLIEQGHITADYPVPCRVTSYEQAVELSLAENSGRAEMHPTDQFEAFRKLIDAGQPIEDVAARFGVNPLVVQRRLKLANVAPQFIALYREGKGITLEHLMALAVTDDHERQQQAWDSLRPYERYPEKLRSRLTDDEIQMRHPLVRYVGLKAYEKAGGVVRRDLFADEDGQAQLDGALVSTLALSKLEKQATKLKTEGLAWVDVHLRLDYSTRATYSNVGSIERGPTADERARLDELAAQLAQIEAGEADAEDEDEEDEDAETDAYEQSEKLRDEIDCLHAQLTEPDPAQLALAGAVVSVGDDGKISIERNLLRTEDARRFHSRKKAPSSTEGVAREHSAALLRRLTAHRTLALQAELVQQPMVAVLALTHRLMLDAFYSDFIGSHAVRICGDATALADHAQTLDGCEAQKALDAQRKALDAQLPKESDALFVWLTQQPDDVLLALLAYCVAVRIDGVRSDEGPSEIDALAQLAKLDMRRWWSATVESYLSAIPKARILAVVTEAVSAGAAAPLAKLKKAALAEAAQRQLAGSGWLPRVLRTQA